VTAVSALDLAIVLFYLAGMLALGAVVATRITGFRDYFVAGGQMTTPLLVCTLVSTYYGLDVLFGGSEVAYQDGVVSWFFYARPYYIAIIIAAVFVARRLKRIDALSLPDVAARSYGRGTQAVIAVASFLYSIPLMAIMGIGVLLDLVLGIPFFWGVLLGAGVSLAYTLLGGLVAGALTDTVQFTLMCVTLGVAAAIELRQQGGWNAMAAALPDTFFDPMGTYPVWVLLVFGLSALSVLVEPAFYQRIFAAISYRAVLSALGIGVALWAAFDWVVTVLGMAAAAAGIETDPRYALLMVTLDALPIGFTGLFIAGVIAVAMSTIDSYLLIAGGNLSYDLYRPLFKPQIGDAELLRLTRWMIVVAAATSILFALFFQSIVSAWIFMATMLISAAFVPLMAALYLPRFARPRAGLAASLGGLAVALGFFVAVHAFGSFDDEWGTQIWTVVVRGAEVRLWQEYAVLAALPVSALAFVLGLASGGPASPPKMRGPTMAAAIEPPAHGSSS
jgi:solute:Na+ symporter, SSS family